MREAFQDRLAPGVISNASGPMEGGWWVVDAYETQEAADRLGGRTSAANRHQAERSDAKLRRESRAAEGPAGSHSPASYHKEVLVTGQTSERSRERLLDSSDSVLAVIDVQESFLGRIGADAATSLVERIRWLVMVAGHLGIPVVVTEEEPKVNGSTATAIMDALPPGTVAHTKPVFGLADNPDILADVEETSRRTTVLVGMETDVCVAHSALGLLDRGYRVAVVEDATASPGGEHEPGLRRMQEAGVPLIRVKGLFYEWIRAIQGWYDFEQAHPEAKPPTGIIL